MATTANTKRPSTTAANARRAAKRAKDAADLKWIAAYIGAAMRLPGEGRPAAKA